MYCRLTQDLDISVKCFGNNNNVTCVHRWYTNFMTISESVDN
jgi:hypothetical protein